MFLVYFNCSEPRSSTLHCGGRLNSDYYPGRGGVQFLVPFNAVMHKFSKKKKKKCRTHIKILGDKWVTWSRFRTEVLHTLRTAVLILDATVT